MNFKFIKQEEYVLFNEGYILRKKFDQCDLKKYSHKEVNLKDF